MPQGETQTQQFSNDLSRVSTQSQMHPGVVLIHGAFLPPLGGPTAQGAFRGKRQEEERKGAPG